MGGRDRISTAFPADYINLPACWQDACDPGLCFRIFEAFPIPVEVFAVDGTAVMINRAGLSISGVTEASKIVGTYNVLKDPVIAELGILDRIMKAFNGDNVMLENVKAPLASIRQTYMNSFRGLECIYHDGLVFPMRDSEEKITHIVLMLIPRKEYSKGSSITKAVEYLDTHWFDEFSLQELAKTVHMSPYHFSRSFKREVGITPYKYYMNIKIARIKEKLEKTDVSIREAFSQCGMDYNGYYSNSFKQRTGMTPTEYRKSIRTK